MKILWKFRNLFSLSVRVIPTSPNAHKQFNECVIMRHVVFGH